MPTIFQPTIFNINHRALQKIRDTQNNLPNTNRYTASKPNHLVTYVKGIKQTQYYDPVLESISNEKSRYARRVSYSNQSEKIDYLHNALIEAIENCEKRYQNHSSFEVSECQQNECEIYTDRICLIKGFKLFHLCRYFEIVKNCFKKPDATKPPVNSNQRFVSAFGIP